MASTRDPRLATFCNAQAEKVFHAVVFENQVWHRDPYDVDHVHGEARERFEQALSMATHPDSEKRRGQVLLLRGESGSGKTHLMRAFRNRLHADFKGFFCYMQMTSPTTNYDHYIMHGILESLDKPYEGPISRTGLMLLSTLLMDQPDVAALPELNRFRDQALDLAQLPQLVFDITNQILMIPQFSDLNENLIQALLYLQADNNAIKKRIMQFMRGEPLSEMASKQIGGLRPGADLSLFQRKMIQGIGTLIQQINEGALVICLDQVENIQKMDNAETRFVTAIDSALALAESIPNAVIVLSCLDDIYALFREKIYRSARDRIELEHPKPVYLGADIGFDNLKAVIGRRLEHLFDSQDPGWQESDPLFPFSSEFIDSLNRLPIREALNRCDRVQESSISGGEYQEPAIEETRSGKKEALIERLDGLWNDYRSTAEQRLPDEDEALAGVLAAAIGACMGETSHGHHFRCRRKELTKNTSGLTVDIRDCHDRPIRSVAVAICNKTKNGGGTRETVERY